MNLHYKFYIPSFRTYFLIIITNQLKLKKMEAPKRVFIIETISFFIYKLYEITEAGKNLIDCSNFRKSLANRVEELNGVLE